jgi:ABC-type lipoprotein export system ATPase subunit
MQTPLFCCQNISKKFFYPDAFTLFEELSFAIGEGETVAICGRSGSGKSTLLQIFGLLDLPSSGALFYRGQPIRSNIPEQRGRHIGFVFQNFQLLEDYTAEENVMMPALIARRSDIALQDQAEILLSKVGLAERLHFSSKQLSGGEKQRVAIARALMNDPELLIADEPTGSLDQEHARGVEDLLFDLVKEKNKALILATHDPKLAARCHRKYELSQGKLSLVL